MEKIYLLTAVSFGVIPLILATIIHNDVMGVISAVVLITSVFYLAVSRVLSAPCPNDTKERKKTND